MLLDVQGFESGGVWPAVLTPYAMLASFGGIKSYDLRGGKV